MSRLNSEIYSDENDEELVFLAEDEISLGEGKGKAIPDLANPNFGTSDVWKILIVDDESDVHRATQIALRNLAFEGKAIVFFSAYSAHECKQIITEVHPDIAVVLLDVVMETNDAGLQVVKYIREELKNQQTRIILRTGHPGEAPEESVILDYDINDYKLKVELTRQRMLVAVITALRSYRDLLTIANQKAELEQTVKRLQQTQQRLEEYTQTLEITVAERTAALKVINQQLHRLATLDGLTHIPNRRRFDEYWQEQWLLMAKQQEPISLILIDVDYFKYYNDKYGHQAGDRCLYTIAQVIKQTLRRSMDLVARYGGEEFVVVLPHSLIEGARTTAEAIIIAVQNLDLPHAQSLVSDRVTISLGICSIVPQTNISSVTPIAIADKALYQAKKDGRNRYCIYGENSVQI
ncbi:diguanylate cyclase domain-containing protein [Merismopedia glauca]|uniref:Response regulator receiver protein n=1 Tax=Merismopedia glauca CCAP 1448/3 TaxID=1296344 RepID=A0A2T1BXH9_9CYAN|nr:diguanylate cyclase [Merismopedia glauca]PSB00634.1 response regulator receiver protein [Merismopedia glauca CCAP 1448/3]